VVGVADYTTNILKTVDYAKHAN